MAGVQVFGARVAPVHFRDEDWKCSGGFHPPLELPIGTTDMEFHIIATGGDDFSKIRSTLAVDLTGPVFLPAEDKRLFEVFHGFRMPIKHYHDLISTWSNTFGFQHFYFGGSTGASHEFDVQFWAIFP